MFIKFQLWKFQAPVLQDIQQKQEQWLYIDCMDFCGYMFSEHSHDFNRNIQSMSRQVKALLTRIIEN